jgi:hypothetical protein
MKSGAGGFVGLPSYTSERPFPVKVLQVSENTGDFFGSKLTPGAILLLPSLLDLIPGPETVFQGQPVLKDSVASDQRSAFFNRLSLLKDMDEDGKHCHFLMQVGYEASRFTVNVLEFCECSPPRQMYCDPVAAADLFFDFTRLYAHSVASWRL